MVEQRPREPRAAPSAQRETNAITRSAVLVRRGLFDADGTLSLTSDRLRFSPSWLAQRSGPDASVDLPLASIEAVKLVGVRRELEIVAAGARWRWAGFPVIEIYRRLHGLPDPGGVHLSWIAQLRRGPLAHPGLLLLTARGLRFVSTSTLDALIGITLDLEIDVARLSTVVADARSLSIQASTAHWQLEMERAPSVVDALAALMLRTPSPGEPTSSERGAFELGEEIDALLAGWPDALAVTEEDPPRLAGPVIVHRAGVEAARYFLVQTERSVLLIPSKSDGTGRGVQVFALSAVGPARDTPVADGAILVRTGTAMLPVFPRGAEAFARSFWQCVRRSDPPPPPDPFAFAATPSTHDLSADAINRRGALRLRPPTPVAVSLSLLRTPTSASEMKPGEVVEGELVDLSAEGLCVAVARELPSSAEIEVTMTVDDARFTVPARVVYCRRRRGETSFRCGLRLAEGALNARLWLQRYWADVQREELRQRAQELEALENRER